MDHLSERNQSTKDDFSGEVKTEKQTKYKFQCEVCMKCFSSNQSLNEHKNLHKNAKPYKCHICEKSFRYGSQLCIHRRKFHSTVDVKFPKLTDLLRTVKSEESHIVGLIEIVRLPSIGASQPKVLPRLEGLENNI